MKEIVAKSGGEAKLRLRGKGSGYVERDIKAESLEPLQLCISCPSREGYSIAVQCTEALLRGIYEAYSQWRAGRGMPALIPQIRMTERHQTGGEDGRDRSPGRSEGPVLPKRRRGGGRGRRPKAKAAPPAARGLAGSEALALAEPAGRPS